MAARYSQGGVGRSSYLQTANDRFKKKFGPVLWGSIIVATVLHFAVIRFFPQLKAADLAIRASELEAVELPPEIKIPPAPDPIQRPALPVVAEVELEDDATIAPTTFEQNPVESLPAPPANVPTLGDRPVFTPYEVGPRLRDPAKAARIVESHYPVLLSRAGFSGTVTVWAFIDTEGVVRNALVNASSGHERLDEAAVEAVKEFLFHPALYRDGKVPVWVAIPITFQLK